MLQKIKEFMAGLEKDEAPRHAPPCAVPECPTEGQCPGRMRRPLGGVHQCNCGEDPRCPLLLAQCP